MKIIKGTTRIVFVFNKFVIKIPNGTYSHKHFINGCYCNWSERMYYKYFWQKAGLWGKRKSINVIPSLYCAPFGLFQIQLKAEPLETLTNKQKKQLIKDFKYYTSDIKKANFGMFRGRIVVFDYSETPI